MRIDAIDLYLVENNPIGRGVLFTDPLRATR